MTDASVPRLSVFATQPKERAEPIELPKSQPFGAPVFITDAVTPLAGETVLSLLMKRMMKEDDPE